LETANAFKLDDLRDALDGVVKDYGDKVTLRKFKREAGMAWQRKFPGNEPQGAFQAFIKNNIGTVRENNRELSHQDHMRMVGKMWSDNKKNKTRFYNETIIGNKRNVSEI
jgi:hypothetical protein